LVAELLGELDAVVGQHGPYPIGNDAQKIFGKFSGRSSVGFVLWLRHCKLACAVYGDEKVKLFFGSLNFGNINVKNPIG
jgi:hypothetical protein